MQQAVDSAGVDKLNQEYAPAQATFGEILQQIDAFYSDGSNANIPVLYARQYCVRKMNGSSPKELEGYASAIRLVVNRWIEKNRSQSPEASAQEPIGSPLDQFSKAYSSFKDAELGTMSLALAVQLSKDLKINDGGYMVALRGAVKTDELPDTRLEYASKGIEANDIYIEKLFRDFGEESEHLNEAVVALVRTAGLIPSEAYRNEALAIAHDARTIQETYDTIRNLNYEIFKLRKSILQAIVDGHGVLPMRVLSTNGPKVPPLSRQIEDMFTQNTRASQRLVDAFTSLQAKSGMRSYPNKLDNAQGNSQP